VVNHPANVSFEEAAASWMQYLTACGALVGQAKLTQGDSIIVTAASSSVGIAGFQVAKVVGATVIATTRTAAKPQALLEQGADPVVITCGLVARVMEITTGAGARVVFDPVGFPDVARPDAGPLVIKQLKPLIASTLTLDQIEETTRFEEATRFLESNSQVGMIVGND
jgi:NADPH:quinone reductase-like Zn-dependent oxidoreductase